MSFIASAAASAFQGVPSWNLTPWRSVKRQVVGLVCSHFVASSGTSSLVTGSRLSSASVTLRMTGYEKLAVASWAANIGGSSLRAITRLPFGSTRAVPAGAIVGLAGTGCWAAGAAVGTAGAAAVGAAGAGAAG